MKLNDRNEPEIESDSESKSAKRFKTDPALFAVPTTEEAYALKNTEILYQSNLLKLQLDELLTELAIPENKQKRFEAIINDLKSSLKNLKPIKNIKYSDFALFESHKLQLPLKELCKTAFKDGTYNFSPPRETFLLGSFLHQTQISREVATSCDLAFEMDAEFFNERDYLNYRYFTKKSLYMAQVYAQLSTTKKYANSNNVKFEFLAEYSSPYNPTLCMIFISEGFEVRFHALPASGSFKPSRFSPGQANVRKEFFLGNLDPNGDLCKLKETENEDELTPRYNSEMLADIVARENNAYIKNTFNESKSVFDAVKLLKLWLFKRGLNKGSNCFDNFTLSMFVAHLLSTRQINPLMSRYQIFRIVLLNLSKSEWHIRGVNVKRHSDQETLFHKHFPVVFLDSTGHLNLTARMNKFTYMKLKHDAQISLNLLNDESSDNFEDLFIRNHYFSIYFDSLIKIDPANHVKFYTDIVKKDISRLGRMIDLFNCSYELTTNSVLELIQRALETKTALVYADHIEKLRWSVNTVPKLSMMETPSILIGLLFGEKYDLELIRGPESTSPDAAEFRKFWGSKSELRRFKDASICEAVYFEAKTIAKKRIIYSEIIKHILNYHMSINDEHIKFVDNRRLNKLLGLPAGITDSEYGTGEERLADVGNKLDEFARILTNLKDLPLSISSVYGLTSALRRTDPFPPLAHHFKYSKQSERALYAVRGPPSSSKNKRRTNQGVSEQQVRLVPKSEPLGPVAVPYLKPLEVCIHLESSGHWPDDLACIARLKAAFHLKIVQMLRETYGVAGEAKCDYFDVFFKGCLFRVRVCTSSELMLVRTRLNEQNVRVTFETARSLAYEKLMFDMAKLTGFIQAFEKKYDCYSGVCRLAKRWLSSHFLLEYFEEEAIDLICAFLFSHPSSYDPPKSIVTGFLRFLELMANFDWKNQALIIDPDNEIKKEDLLDAKLRFQENRASLAPVYIITHFDVKKTNSVFTREKPTIQNLCRTVLQAKHSLNSLKTCIQNFDSNENFKSIFKPNVGHFDLAIKLKPNYCAKAYQSVDLTEGVFLPHYRNIEDESKSNQTSFPVVDFDPARLYVNELRDSYGDLALFFYDFYGCTQIYVLFKPDAIKPKEAKIANAKYSVINSSSGKFELNLEAVIDDFKIIGNEFVQDVVILNQKIFQ